MLSYQSAPARTGLPQSATLAANERIRAIQATGESVVHLAFGEAGLPVLPEVAAALSAAATENSYGPTAGTEAVRAAAAGYLSRRGVPTEPDQIVAGPGSKPLLYALLTVLPGDIVLPRPSWVSYAAQAALAGKDVIWVDVPEHTGGVPDPEALENALLEARWKGQRPGVLVVTSPDNPTGTTPNAELVRQVCAVAERYGLVVISDEIYRDLAHDPDALLSPATVFPERTIVTTGLSKATALGGWRLGFCRIPATREGAQLRERLVGVASEVWSNPAMPVQTAAGYLLDEPTEVREYVRMGRELHRKVVTEAYRLIVAAGAACRAPGGGFYLYPDLEPARERFQLRSGMDLAEVLLTKYRVGVLCGEAFGDDPRVLRFRMATSLLYGTNDVQRWEALHSADPVALPWIADALNRLAEAVDDLTGGSTG
ncbi:aminotransferase class I/II-fold pyridoxal phosphate-dependent enzyme [Allokutzneria sp. A3M-2-11 16]|uniref:pyridoxal phosphate-dependent aminotransferase n=1 Tax=Allokutzneria sp. A3M-2-11 16 TaxID=2962043 RepID=UPI0020B78128|nr:aminotransferase class I/II-fold pyridoxal phosphate-dependent enzyme [Allokutzneria sp. A3M-2-11 16]MCP3800476.1 aminotransferase class I/II-fold pyridoxal phosphate-dependent enzyme [Allokutzneria sp. A3M-2-11 16]